MTSRLRKIIGHEEEQRRSMHINRPQSYDTTTQPMREGFAQGRSEYFITMFQDPARPLRENNNSMFQDPIQLTQNSPWISIGIVVMNK